MFLGHFKGGVLANVVLNYAMLFQIVFYICKKRAVLQNLVHTIAFVTDFGAFFLISGGILAFFCACFSRISVPMYQFCFGKNINTVHSITKIVQLNYSQSTNLCKM